MKVQIFTHKKILYLAALFFISFSIFVLVKRATYKSNDLQITILGFNDLGMHCIQPDYSKFLILPPGNNILVQVFKKGSKPEMLSKGIRVKYKINSQKDPSKYSNFWTYAKQYGYSVPKNIGITGNGLEGDMVYNSSQKYWEAIAIPVTSLTGGEGPASPYQTATISVYDQKNNRLLAEFGSLVTPVSPEMNCLECHQEWSNILRDHDEAEKTTLYSDSLKGSLHRCNECHSDPILEAPGKRGIPSLSLAMHGFHANKVSRNNNTPVCYSCHPGRITDCNRGVMKANGIDCQDCHGSMSIVAKSIEAGRSPWLQEPTCQQCHSPKYQVNPSQLYRRSYLMNGPAPEMNNIILCASCHNGPHAEWPSLRELDNILPLTYQGKPTFIKDCKVCHTGGTGKTHQ